MASAPEAQQKLHGASPSETELVIPSGPPAAHSTLSVKRHTVGRAIVVATAVKQVSPTHTRDNAVILTPPSEVGPDAKELRWTAEWKGVKDCIPVEFLFCILSLFYLAIKAP